MLGLYRPPAACVRQISTRLQAQLRVHLVLLAARHQRAPRRPQHASQTCLTTAHRALTMPMAVQQMQHVLHVLVERRVLQVL